MKPNVLEKIHQPEVFGKIFFNVNTINIVLQQPGIVINTQSTFMFVEKYKFSKF